MLSLRLQSMEELLPEHNFLIDVGTDHALFPISALLNNRVEMAWGVDKRAAPLLAAQRNIERVGGLSGRLLLVQSDGFSRLRVERPAVVSIAGMGGREMIRILSGTDHLPLEQLLLQPNGKEDELRAWLWEQGWKSIEERMIIERHRFYPTMRFSKKELGAQGGLFEARYGPLFMEERSEAWLAWLQHDLVALQRGKKKAGTRFPQHKELLIAELQSLLQGY